MNKYLKCFRIFLSGQKKKKEENIRVDISYLPLKSTS